MNTFKPTQAEINEITRNPVLTACDALPTEKRERISDALLCGLLIIAIAVASVVFQWWAAR